MKKQVFVIGAAAIVLSLASPALAQGSGRGPVATTCSSEISRYCADKKHGGGAVRDCLESICWADEEKPESCKESK